MGRSRARRRRDASRPARARCCTHGRRPLHHANDICKIAKMPVKWSLLWCVNLGVRSHAPPLDSIASALASRKIDFGKTKSGLKKNFAHISSGASLSRLRRHESSESASTDSQKRPSMSLRNPWTRLPTRLSRHRFTLRVASEQSEFREPFASACSATSR